MKYVYLIKSEESGLYKIGVSKNPNTRLKQLQTGNGDKLKLLEKFQTDHAFKVESAMKNTYSYLRKNGEWFELSLKEEFDFTKNCEKFDKNIRLLIENDNPFIKKT